MADAGQEAGREVSATRLAMRSLASLRPSLDRLEASLVDRARLELVSWEQIGADLGITKQTAHRRHATHEPPAPRPRRRRVPPDAERLVAGLGDEDRLLGLLEQELAMRRSQPIDRGPDSSSAPRDASDPVTPG